MLDKTVNTIIRDRAVFARELEYIKEMAKDDLIDDCLELAENNYVKESLDELMEAKEAIDKMSGEDSISEEREVNNILEATEDLTFDQMIDLDMLVERANG